MRISTPSATCASPSCSHHNVSVGAIGGSRSPQECVQIRSGTMNLNEYRLADFTVDTQNSGTGGGVPFHCGHTIAGLGNDARIGVSPGLPSL